MPYERETETLPDLSNGLIIMQLGLMEVETCANVFLIDAVKFGLSLSQHTTHWSSSNWTSVHGGFVM